jgi:hypothetical protein
MNGIFLPFNWKRQLKYTFKKLRKNSLRKVSRKEAMSCQRNIFPFLHINFSFVLSLLMLYIYRPDKDTTLEAYPIQGYSKGDLLNERKPYYKKDC